MGSLDPMRHPSAPALLLPRLVPVATAAALCAALAGCGGGSSDKPVFRPLTYDYLTPLRLNVGQVTIEDHAQPTGGPGDLAGAAPTPPDQALRQMAKDRLLASGNSGTAVFTIDQATITGQPGGTLDGNLAVHLDIVSNSGGHAGYAEAHVSREFVPGSGTDNDGIRSQLYNLTTQMMQDMNVEFEFQLRRTLSDWMVDASGAPIAGAVEQQPLNGPNGAPVTGTPLPPAGAMPQGTTAPASVGSPLQLAPTSAAPSAPPPAMPPPVMAPSAIDPTGQAAPGPAQLSPPAGYLVPPPGAVAAPAAPPPAPGDLPPTGSGY